MTLLWQLEGHRGKGEGIVGASLVLVLMTYKRTVFSQGTREVQIWQAS